MKKILEKQTDLDQEKDLFLAYFVLRVYTIYCMEWII